MAPQPSCIPSYFATSSSSFHVTPSLLSKQRNPLAWEHGDDKLDDHPARNCLLMIPGRRLQRRGCHNRNFAAILRPWGEEEIEQLTLGLNDLNLAKWLAFVPHPYSTSHAKNWIKRCQEISSAGLRPIAYEFAVELRPERLVIGGVSLNKIDWKAGTGGGGDLPVFFGPCST
jgi:hypothetical protein